MKAVNLIPAEARRGTGGSRGSLPEPPALMLLGGLAVALVFVTVYVLTSNKISERKARIASAQAQLSAAEAQAEQFNNYKQFASLAQARVQTVIQIAGSRFDWHAALADLAQVVPANTSLQSLTATVSPDASVSAAGGGASGSSAGSASSVRGDITAPAFELSGCTKSQDDVARLMSRLRLINGVTRVTLADSTKPQGSQPASTPASSSNGSSSQGCGANAPSFDLAVFFKALPGSTSSAAGSSSAGPAAAPTSTTTATPATTTTPAGTNTAATTATTPGGTATTSGATATTPSSSQPTTGASSSGAAK